MTALLQILNLPSTSCSTFEIDQAYRNQTFLALGGLKHDHEPLYAVSDAYQVMRNPQRRDRYLELGDKRFAEESRDDSYIDAVDLLLGSFGVNKLGLLVPEIPALSIIMASIKLMKATVSLRVPKRALETARRPGWDTGKAKVAQCLGYTRGDYSRVKVMPQLRQLQDLIDDFGNGPEGARTVQNTLIEMFQGISLGLDWMHVVGTIIYVKGKNQYNKCRTLINMKRTHESSIDSLKDAREYVVRCQKLWFKRDLAYIDQVNMFYLVCAFSLFLEVARAMEQTVTHLFDAQKHQISKRKDRAAPAQKLADIGIWMFERDEDFITYDDTLASAIIYAAYHLVYVASRSDKKNLTNVPYEFPSEIFPDRSRSLLKIGIDHREMMMVYNDAGEQQMLQIIMLNSLMASQAASMSFAATC